MASQYLGDRQDDVRATPDETLRGMGQPLQPKPAEADTFVCERRIDFKQQRHATAPSRPAPRNMKKVGALIDDIWAEGPRRPRQPRGGDQPIGHLRQLA